MTTKVQKRFIAFKEADPAGWADLVRGHTGFGPEATEALLHVHGHLHDGKKLTDGHVRMLHALHPHMPVREVAEICASINTAHPGQRADLFLAALADDAAAEAGRFNEAGSDFRQTAELAKHYHQYDISAAIQAKRDGGQIRPDRPERPVDPSSTRAILEQQFVPPGLRRAVEMIDEGDERATYLAKNLLADRLEAADNTLSDDSASLRDTLSAAYTSADIEAEGIDQGWLPQSSD